MLIRLTILLIASIVLLLFLTSRRRLHPFLALLACATAYGICTDMPYEWVLRSIRDGMAASFGSTGLLLLAGAIVAVFLERSGAGQRLASAIGDRWRTRRMTALAVIAGWVSGIGASGEAAFLLLTPLTRAVAGPTGSCAAGAQLSLGFAVLVSSALIVPAPAAIMVKTIFDADMLQILVYGLGAAAVGAGTGVVFVALVARAGWIEASLAGSAGPDPTPTRPPPVPGSNVGPWFAALSVVLPLLLLIVGALGQLPGEPLGRGSGDLLAPLGGSITMLVVVLLLALVIPAWFAGGSARLTEPGWLGAAIEHIAPTLLIVAAAAGFARVLQNSALPDFTGEALSELGAGAGLLLPFGLAAALRFAQGSMSVAMLSAGGFCEPLLASLGLADGSDRAFAALAIGAGAIVGSHANDSLFWVVTRTIGLSPAAGYRLQTLGSSCAGLAAFLALLAMRTVFG